MENISKKYLASLFLFLFDGNLQWTIDKNFTLAPSPFSAAVFFKFWRSNMYGLAEMRFYVMKSSF